jgi:hypothetical protein
MRYFDLADDMTVPGRWSLGAPMDTQGKELEDPWVFRLGQPVPGTGRVRFPTSRPGRPLDFTRAGFSIPVVHVRVASVFAELAPADVQLLPAEVQGQPDQFCLLVATRLIQCIDDEASEEVRRWKPEDGRPEKVGQYRDVWGLRIDPSKVGDAKVFRPWGWTVALIVSEEIKRALEHLGATGTKFEEV